MQISVGFIKQKNVISLLFTNMCVSMIAPIFLWLKMYVCLA